MAAFLDLCRAFDSASHTVIVFKLARMGLTGASLCWMSNFLQGRNFHVAVGGALSSPRPVYRGMPQGSVLSPLLFSVLPSDLPSIQGVHTLVYADDVALMCSALTLLTVQEALQRALQCFTRRRLPTLPSVSLNQTPIPLVSSQRWLRVTLDAPFLTWKKHIAALHFSCACRTALMRWISGTKWGQIETFSLGSVKLWFAASSLM